LGCYCEVGSLLAFVVGGKLKTMLLRMFHNVVCPSVYFISHIFTSG
jgi:hypothetical protein